MHIGIAGNIGSGKTTLTTLLARHYGWTPKFESVTYNPYLADYYADIKRWSFALEMYFLTRRLHDVIEIGKSDDVIIQDRTLFEGVHIFVANNYAQGNLSERDYNTFMDSYNVMMSVVKQPDLLLTSVLSSFVAVTVKLYDLPEPRPVMSICRVSTVPLTVSRRRTGKNLRPGSGEAFVMSVKLQPVPSFSMRSLRNSVFPNSIVT